MRKPFFAALLACSTLLFGGATHAGLVDNTQVSIWTDGSSGLQSANGVLRAARNSADSTQFIGCSRYAYDTGSDSIVCSAQNASGTYLSCYTSSSNMLRVAETLSSAAYLYFVVNTDGTCDRVITMLGSYNM